MKKSGIFAFLFVAIIAIVFSYFLWLENVRKLDALCAEKNWYACASASDGDFALKLNFEGFKQDPALCMRNYFSELAGTTNQFPVSPGLVVVDEKEEKRLASFILKRAKFYEYQVNLPHLAEAYMRCGVGLQRDQCRRSLADLKNSSTKQGQFKHLAAVNMEQLALALRALSDLYANNNKFLIAERAASESIDLTGQAMLLAGDDTDLNERLHSQQLLARAAHIKLLRMQNQNDKADKETLLLLH